MLRVKFDGVLMTFPLQFQEPEWFLLLPALFFAGWWWPQLGLYRPLRLLLCLLCCLILSRPSMRLQDDSLDLYVLLDRSDSTEELIDQGLPEWRKLLENAKPSSRDEIHWLNYANEVATLGSDGAVFTGSRKLTRTALALQTVASLAKENKPSRVLVFTDGYSTEPLQEATALLQSRGIPLDYRFIRENSIDDFRVARIELPDRVQAGEPFLISVTLRGSRDEEVPLSLLRDGQLLTETKVRLVNGVGKIEFTDRLSRACSSEYSARINPVKDTHSGNNQLSRWIEITGGPRVLLVSRYANDPLADILRKQSFDVDLVTEPGRLRANQLTGTRAVIINNVPAHELPNEFLRALPFYVQEQGGGLMMAGGDRSFGAGGFFESVIDPLLPVSMELKSEHRKLSVALAIVMDRSGSMSVSVSPGVTKMDLANQGAINAINLLGRMDQVAVIAVDSAPQTFVPMTRIDDKQQALTARTRKVTSSGGGIFVYEGLKAGWEALKKSSAGTRHLILFTDTADTEEPGDYKRLIKEMTQEGATISVIGMGSKSDPDAQLCEDIAKRGNGRMFYSDKPQDIPNIFAQETVTIARSAFIKELTQAKPTGRWTEISPKNVQWLSQIDGYNLSYAREDATVSLVSQDEYLAPLVATARRGLGRTAAISFPLGGEHSQLVRAWPDYANFLQTTTRWLMGLDLPPGIGLKHQTQGTQLSLDLLYDPEKWSDTFWQNPPRIRLKSQSQDPAFDAPWRRIAPGQFSLTRDFEEGSIIRGAIQIGPHAIPFGPITVGSSVEWAFDPDAVKGLRDASRATSGRELIDLSDAWLRPTMIQDRSLQIPLLLGTIAIFLLEALTTRTGWSLPVWERNKTARSPKPTRQPKVGRVNVAKPQDSTPSPSLSQPDPKLDLDQSRRQRFQKAKDRK
jgi:hypothetical protein